MSNVTSPKQNLNSTEDISWTPGFASDQVRALSSAEAELHGIVGGSGTRNLHVAQVRRDWRNINVDVETDSTAAIGMCSRTSDKKTRHIQVRCLWILDAIRDKVVRLKKVKGTETEADMGTNDFDGPSFQHLLQKLPLKPAQCRLLLGLIATASGGSVAESQVARDEGDFWTFSAQFSTSIMVAFAP